jgi:hypothetical protein
MNIIVNLTASGRARSFELGQVGGGDLGTCIHEGRRKRRSDDDEEYTDLMG